MTNRELLSRIKASMDKYPKDEKAYEDYFAIIREIGKDEGIRSAIPDVRRLRSFITAKMRQNVNTDMTIELYELLKRTYLYTAKDIFVDYMTYLEWNRKPQERFWQPRAKILAPHANALQALADDELDELFLSQPARTGKTTLALFFVTWLIGKNPELSNLYSAFSDVITNAFYSGVLEILQDPMTYLWKDVFADQKIAATNAKDETIDIGRKKRYPSLSCRSLYGTLNGAVDARGVIISDDLIGGIEEAMNKDRMMSAWSKVDNNLIPRAKQGCKLLWWGTRWSVADPIGMRIDMLENDRRFNGHRYKIINIPALNDMGESNFEYDYGVGFDTKYYQMRKASFERTDDLASWNAQYMGQPVERTGQLFEPSDLRYFNGELGGDEHIVRKFMAIDPAFGGGDYCAGAVCYTYDDGCTYVVDVVYSNADKKVTQPIIANKIEKWKLNYVQVECTLSTASFAEGIERVLQDKQYRCNLVTKPAPISTAKNYRIFDKAPEIKELIFLAGEKRDKTYEQFMQNVYSFSMTGKNKHDDAPDCLAMCVDVLVSGGSNVRVARRAF